MSSIISIFNQHFIEMFDDILVIFPNNVDIMTAKNSILTFKKMNPAIIIKVWNKYIANKYKEQIDNDDISFFINKDYSHDLEYMKNPDVIMDVINRIREPVNNMNQSDQVKTMKYIKNLTKLSLSYSS
jgi:hypothetical protein